MSQVWNPRPSTTVSLTTLIITASIMLTFSSILCLLRHHSIVRFHWCTRTQQTPPFPSSCRHIHECVLCFIFARPTIERPLFYQLSSAGMTESSFLAIELAATSLDSLFAITTFHTKGKPHVYSSVSLIFISTLPLKVAHMEC